MKRLIYSIVIIIAITCSGYSQAQEQVLSISNTDKKSPKLIIYGSDTCHYCIDTKAYLKEKQIDFVYYDVDVNLSKQREMVLKLQNAGISLDNLSLPVVEKKGELLMNNGNFDTFLKGLTE
ncbi:glutaredoxin family protein [Tamlana sp. I1]|uniref:glutaredoxin family protein n=1 Tax=Tamlana sp. I1 TaxID=2762061 RepID=UPI001890077E|nr:glutaredoxin family protein [Tamlana sp. I1]